MISLALEGTVEHIFIANYSGEPMVELAEVEAVAGSGLQGDRYVAQTGYWSGVDECQVTLIEAEILERVLEDAQVSMLNGEHRRNIVTRGIRLQQLLGKQFRIGQAIMEYQGPRPPCAHIRAIAGANVAASLIGQRGGIGAKVVSSGVIRMNDMVIAI